MDMNFYFSMFVPWKVSSSQTMADSLAGTVFSIGFCDLLQLEVCCPHSSSKKLFYEVD